jgi:hypothetical protein
MYMRNTSVSVYLASIAALASCVCALPAPAAGPAETGMINSGTLGRFNVRLTVSEEFGSERFQERVVAGVPFPRGILKTTEKLFVLNPMRNQCKSRFRPLAWWPDGSIRWVLAEFQTDMHYPTLEEFFLREGTRRHPKRPDRKFYSALDVREDDDAVTLDSGAVKLVVRKKGFNLFDRIWVDDTGQLNYDEDSLVVDRGGYFHVTADGRKLSAASDPGIKLSLEDKAMTHAVVKARGTLSDEGGASALRFLLRITVFENSNQVFLDCTVENAGDKPAGLGRVTAGVTRRATENMTYDFRFGTSAGEVSGAVPKGSEQKTVSLDVSDPRTFSVAGPAAEFARRGPLKGTPLWGSDRDFGYARIFTSARGKMLPTDYCITAAMKHLWQRHPASLQVGPAFGAAVHCLSSPGNAAAAKLPPGGKLDWTLAFSFSGFKSRLEADWATFKQPLRTVTDHSWYCLDTSCFGVLAPADSGYYEKKNWLDVRAFDRRFEKSFEAVRKTASYGSPDYGNLSCPDGCDLAHVLVLQFARTGRREYLDAALLAARRVQRVPVRSLADCAAARGIFDRYCLTGDPESGAAVMARADLALRERAGVSTPADLAAAISALLCGSSASGEDEYLDAALKTAKEKASVLAGAKDGIAVCAEAYEELYDLTDNSSVKEALLEAAKSASAGERILPEHLGLIAFAHEHTRDKTLMEKALAAYRTALSPLATTGAVLARSGLGPVRFTRRLADVAGMRTGTKKRRRKAGEIEIDLVW